MRSPNTKFQLSSFHTEGGVFEVMDGHPHTLMDNNFFPADPLYPMCPRKIYHGNFSNSPRSLVEISSNV